MSTTAFYIGCAVWAYKDWLGDLFPPGSKNARTYDLTADDIVVEPGDTTADPGLGYIGQLSRHRDCPCVDRSGVQSGDLFSRT